MNYRVSKRVAEKALLSLAPVAATPPDRCAQRETFVFVKRQDHGIGR